MSNEKRAPLLSDRGIKGIINDVLGSGLEDFEQVALSVRDHYEILITRGELRLVKTARIICSADTGWNPQCSECQNTIEGSDIDIGEFCRCGAKIIE